jgi:hypothetical protein
MRCQPPPRIAGWFLESLLPDRDREVVMGDLAEEYAIRAQVASPASVSRWYLGQVYRSLPPVLWSAVRRGRWVGTLSVALGTYIAAGILEFWADAALSRLLAQNPRVNTVVSLIVGLTTMVLGGYVAMWIRRGAARALAGVVTIGVAVLMVTIPNSVPLWYQLAFLIGGPLASLAGGALFQNRQGRQEIATRGRGPAPT